jgi:NRAMP (natural resistance-associated macrophage protein)-like metal ion transporter
MTRSQTNVADSDPAGEGARGLQVLGPGLITGASDDDPSGIATYSQAGAKFGYSLGWTLLLTFPLMVVIQEIAALIGRTTGKGLSSNIRSHYSTRILYPIVFLLFLANAINVGADLGAMGDALALLLHGSKALYIVLFGLICTAAEIFIHYKRYAAILRWLTLVLFAYFGALIFVKVPWVQVVKGLVWPTPSLSVELWTTVVAVFGTTISPYLFFWQASQEVEEIGANAKRKPLTEAPKQARAAIGRIRIDTYIGMALSNIVGLAIMITTAAALHAHGISNIQSSSQAAQSLQPVAGKFAFLIFTLGIIGTGLLAVPVLAGSAAYALSEAFGWPTGLDRKPQQAKAFYATIAIATLIGVALNLTPINPISALFWSAVVNGVVAVPVMATMMLIATNKKIMHRFRLGGALTITGWFATAVMAIAAIGMGITSVL